MNDAERRLLVERHHDASGRGDIDAVHAIYHDDAVIEYPQSGERILGREKLRGLRESHPAKLDLSRQADRRVWRPVDHGVRHQLRRKAREHHQHHGVPRRQGDAGDVVLRGSARPSRVAFRVGRSRAWSDA